MNKSRAGFTLIELLIASAIMALVAIAIVSVFAAGLNVYNRVRSYSDLRTDVLFSLEKIERDLKNVCNISQIDFKGDANKVTFPCLPPGSISYYVDLSSHYLVSEKRDYPAATAQEPPRGSVTRLVYANSVVFSYYYYDPEARAYYWKDSWVKEEDEDELGTDASKLGTPGAAPAKKKTLRVNTPLGVLVKIEYEDRGRTFVLDRTVFFPLAVSLHFARIASEKKEREKSLVEGETKG